MGWIVLIIVVSLVASCLDSDLGKFAIGAGVVAIGCLVLNWILDIGFFVVLAKLCAVAIVLIILGVILSSIFG